MTVRPEVLHFAGVWWALVFPLGTYAAATHGGVADCRALVVSPGGA
ncbi:MAG: hypothetical protein ACLQIK_16370 [Mycobacterium sp.]